MIYACVFGLLFCSTVKFNSYLNRQVTVQEIQVQAAYYSKQIYEDHKKLNLQESFGFADVYPKIDNWNESKMIFVTFKGTDINYFSELKQNFNLKTLVSPMVISIFLSIFSILIAVKKNEKASKLKIFVIFVFAILILSTAVYLLDHISNEYSNEDYRESFNEVRSTYLDASKENEIIGFLDKGYIVVTGHSKGGAEAVHYYNYLKEKIGKDNRLSRLRLVTFAALKVKNNGDLEYDSNAINFSIDSDIANIKNGVNVSLNQSGVEKRISQVETFWFYIIYIFTVSVFVGFVKVSLNQRRGMDFKSRCKDFTVFLLLFIPLFLVLAQDKYYAHSIDSYLEFIDRLIAGRTILSLSAATISSKAILLIYTILVLIAYGFCFSKNGKNS
ncbi:MAG: hypothetical protein CME66_00170 [Halobacteriovoraceae bacterium]|nr:hypothetical protein [Halobacteriovoraceae bacterium]